MSSVKAESFFFRPEPGFDFCAAVFSPPLNNMNEITETMGFKDSLCGMKQIKKEGKGMNDSSRMRKLPGEEEADFFEERNLELGNADDPFFLNRLICTD